MKSEDAPAAAVAVMLIKVMKRYLSIICILCMLLSLAACAPDNIKAPIQPQVNEPQNDTPVSTEPVTDPVTEDISDPEPEPEPEKEPEAEKAPETETAPETEEQKPEGEPETKPEGETETEPAPEVETTEPVSYIADGKKQNKEVKPSLDIDTLSYVKTKTAALKDKTLKMFVTEAGAFKAGDKTEKQWLDSLKDAYGLTVKYTVRSDGMLYPAQMIAAKAGIGPDLITAKIKDMSASLSLMQSALELEDAKYTVFSKNVFDITDGKLFTGVGNGRMLWYNKNIIKDDAPFTLFNANAWTADVMNATFISAKAQKTALLSNDGDWLAFLSTAGEQVSGYTDFDGAIMKVTSDKSIAAAKAYDKILSADGMAVADGQSFSKGNVAFTFTDTPEVNGFEAGFAPLPKTAEDGSCVIDLTGTGVGISKYAKADNVDTALTLAMLWSARYTESRIDKLMFDLKLSKDKAEKYLELCETEGKVYSADGEITTAFTAATFPNVLAKDSSTVYNAFIGAYNRTVLINKRYR